MSRRAPRWPTLLFATALVVTCGPALAADPVPAGAERVTVQMQKPEAFKDFRRRASAWTSARAACWRS
jgi:hypothetical protein